MSFGAGVLPELFTLIIEPDPVPADEDDRWNLVLCFQVARGEDRIDLRYASCAERDVASALDAVRAIWSLSKWKQWAQLVLILGLHPHLATPADIERARLILSAQRPRRRQRTSVTDSHLGSVAAVYAAALEKPTVAVQQHFKVSHSTAARWVGLAREAGHIPPARKSRE